MFSDDQIKATVLFKAPQERNWGASHTAFDNLQKGFKDTDLGKHGTKRIDKLARDLIRRGWIIPKPTSYGLQVALNPRASQTILEFIKKFIKEV
ncbi:MAG: hypothetical protein ACRECH_17140 [Nitrososphaerales archaeon]